VLSYLRIRGLALLDDVVLELAPGMNVLTGETGAGKSIIVDALALLRGARARPDLVRSGEAGCTVDAQFEVPEALRERVSAVLHEHGLPADADELVMQRTVARTGRGRTLVQAELTTQGALAEIGELLVDICSQHEHHSLTRMGRHVELLDAYARNDDELGEYVAAYRTWQRAAVELEELRAKSADAAARVDYLEFQLGELERVAPVPGELVELRKRAALLRASQEWAVFSGVLRQELDDAEDSVLVRLARLLDRAERGAAHSKHLSAIAEQLATAHAASEEASREAARFALELEFEPAELERAEERLHELVLLEKKHGPLDELPPLMEKLRAELDVLKNAESRMEELRQTVEDLHRAAVDLAVRLRETRRVAAGSLGRALEQELVALHLPRARMEARLEPLGPEELGPHGMDRIEFMFSANEGEPLASLTRVASGGELSRVLLALKGVLAASAGVATYVFDEVDAGVGGRVAVAIGQRLAGASQSSQVLCITHLPQIAACADAHFRVEKCVEGKRTVTRVTRLSEAEREEELARMLGGAEVTKSAREHARQLIQEARLARLAGEAAAQPQRKPRARRRAPQH
jgi:DNA repair protein RecN (Recombination protein N)